MNFEDRVLPDTPDGVTVPPDAQGGEQASASAPSPPELRHWLVVTEPEPGVREYDIEHPDCTLMDPESEAGIQFAPYYHECAVDDIVAAIGFPDAFADGTAELPPGRYPLRVHVEHTPSLPTNGGEEWDVWLEVVPA